MDNGVGIAGLAPSAQLLVAKVVTKSRAIPVEAEAKAIRWAVDNGARVINMSLGGIRDPLDPERDTYSRLEADAVAYAVTNGVVVVAAVGNSDQAPASPWKYASYPSALPHVLGVSAMTDTGGIPTFSNRDRIYNDIAAPGLRILSILPRPLTARFPACSEQGYSSCGPEEYREAQGTSFAAPQVSAAAAVLLSLRPTLWPEQVTRILQQTTVDLDASTGCAACGSGRDAYSGWGRLDVAAAIAALSKRLPERDFYETNDDLGTRAYTAYGSNRRIQATVDFWDDQDDVYAIELDRNQPVYVGLTGADASVDLGLAFWLPQARSIERVADFRYRVRTSARSGARQYLSYKPSLGGTFYIQVRMSSPGATRYRLTDRQGLKLKPSLRSRCGLRTVGARRTRAGFPTTIVRGGTSLVTTAPAPTNASSPISIPGQRIAPPPTRAPRRIVGPAMRSWRASVRPMKLSFVVTTHGAMKTCSSSVE